MAAPKRKNIAREIRDIRFPTSHVPHAPAAPEVPVRRVRPVASPSSAGREAGRAAASPPRRRTRFPKRALVASFFAVVFVAALGGFLWYRQQIASAARLRAALSGNAASAAANQDQLASLLGLGSMPTTWSGWTSLLGSLFSSYGGAGKTSIHALNAAGNAASVLQSLPAALLANDGPAFTGGLATLSQDLATLHDSLQAIDSAGPGGVKAVIPGISSYLSYAPDIDRAREATDALAALVKAPGSHHLLILFGNSAELRPGGGFLGSFGDLSFGNGAIQGLSVHDVNEVDRGLAANIVPPKPLQTIVGRWRAADANWFFDYRASAEKTLQIMASSTFYASSSLDGAILISPKVIQDLLAATGPITLKDSTTTVDAATVMPLIQREVQAGQASGAEDPKQILAELLPPLEAKLQDLSATAQASLLAAAQNWIKDRDLELYFRDPALAKVAAHYGADGAVYVTPQNFSGDYLAAVNANLGGGKSDAYISDAVEIESYLRQDGVVMDRTTVARTSRAGADAEWWYRVTNRDYLQIFTPAGATLTAAKGGATRSAAPKADYAHGFSKDGDAAALDASLVPSLAAAPSVSQFAEAGRTVFATWLTTPAGKSSTAAFEYERPLPHAFAAGDVYTFVYERQSGAQQSLHAILHAPPGLKWKESGDITYEYAATSTPGRILLNLTLEQI